MIILKEQNTPQTFSFIPRELKATTIVLRNESTGSETNIAADFFLSDYYLTTTSVFNLKENTFYNLSIKNNNEIVYQDKVFCTNQQSSTYTVNENQYATPTEDNDDYITPDMDDTVTIGTQIWATKNLNVTTYRDGTPITGWVDYEGNPTNGDIYGKLYTGDIIKNPKGLAPEGYHIPTDAEWTILTDYLGGLAVAGGKMKSTGTELWNAPNTGATNESGFTGLPGGFLQGFNYAFNNQSTRGYFWSSSELETDSTKLWYRYINHDNDDVVRVSASKINGFSVRLIKDI
jgi:uncharacterized protein (TIGR02145 family)